MFKKILAWMKHLAKQAITEAIASAWSAIGNPTGQAAAITDVNGFIAAVGTKLGPEGEVLELLAEGPIDGALRSAATALGTSATEATVTEYVLKHIGIDD